MITARSLRDELNKIQDDNLLDRRVLILTDTNELLEAERVGFGKAFVSSISPKDSDQYNVYRMSSTDNNERIEVMVIAPKDV